MQQPDQQQLYQQIEAALEQMLVGKPSHPIEQTTGDPLVNRIIELVNMLSGNFAEMARFARGLSSGDLDLDIPGRRNYLAAPLKELHSQLNSFVWTAQQLQKGRAVERLDYMGELSAAMNGLIDKLCSNGPPPAQGADSCGESAVDSLKYHQMYGALNHLRQMILLVDEGRGILFANAPAIRHFGKLEQLQEPLDGTQSPLEQLLYAHSNEEGTFPAYREICDDARGVWYKVISDQILFPQGDKAYLHSIEDISEWKTSESQLKISATTDPLTGVYNRGLAITAIQNALSDRSTVTSCAAFIDIDDLKIINDTHGHNEGDYAIKTIAQILLSSVRSIDTVCRFGGDEFIVVFSNCTMEVAETVIKRISDKFRVINDSHAKPYCLSFSYGITQIDDKSSDNVKDLIQLMDKKMYERKKAKKRALQLGR